MKRNFFFAMLATLCLLCLLCSCSNNEINLVPGAWQDCYNGKVITIRNQGTIALFSPPGEPDSYYRGSRFDHSGNFLTLQRNGHVYVSEWYDGYDSFRHDCLMGPVDSFDAIGAQEVASGECYLGIGIGLIKKPDGRGLNAMSYNEIVNPGHWQVESTDTSATFTQTLESEKYSYVYEKTVSLGAEGEMTISHRLLNNGPDSLIANVYNHNFFVLDGAKTGVATHVDFPFKPTGEWQKGKRYSEDVAFVDNGIRFSSDLQEEQSVTVRSILTDEGKLPTHDFFLSNTDNDLSVAVHSEEQVQRMQFWACQRVACVEPFIHISVAPGQSQEWALYYTLK